MHNCKRITNLPERGAYHLFLVLFPFNMADANTLIPLMELSDDLEMEMYFFRRQRRNHSAFLCGFIYEKKFKLN